MSVTILGGGIGGLSSAFYLASRSATKINLFEATSRLAGWMKSEQLDGYTFESSARTLRPKGVPGNTTLELIQMLEMENKIVPVKPDVGGKFRLIWSRSKSITAVTPESDAQLKALFSSEDATDNESIYDFTARKFNKELADSVISPMVAGICGGDARDISAKFLVKGNRSEQFEQNDLYKKAQAERWNFYSLQGGIQTLPDTIAQKLSAMGQVSLNVDASCEKIHFKDDGTVEVTVNGKAHTTNFLISSLPSFALAPLLESQHPDLAKELRAMKSNTVAMVNLHFKSEDLLKYKGFGVFVPASEDSAVRGIIFDSCCFGMKGTTLTAMIGEPHANANDSKLLETSLQSVKEILNISESPDKFKVQVLQKSFPQYSIGHYDRIKRIKNYITSNDLPLSLCGQSYDGIGINEVILSGKLAAQAVNF
jgi:oxygen-dependent protoporphyrinogen oxidase